MNKTKIDWCDRTWNPVTGCRHNCGYCFARGFAQRFGGCVLHQLDMEQCNIKTIQCEFKPNEILSLEEPLTRITKSGYEVKAAYPAGFNPTFHRYRLDEPKHVKKPQRIFAVDCGDLFGTWVPNEWLLEVFAAAAAAPWHRYVYLTKAALGYYRLNKPEISGAPQTKAILPISVFGMSATNDRDARRAMNDLGDVPKAAAALLCLEPLHERIYLDRHQLSRIEWVIVGAETGNRKGKVTPRREWVQAIVDTCREAGTPVFLKGNLAAVWGDELIQEYPAVLRGVGE
jgi:protein gp37